MARERKIHKNIDSKLHKYCSLCNGGAGVWVLLSCFGKRKSSWDGLLNNCKDCVNNTNKQYRSLPINKAKQKEYNRQYSVKPEVKLKRKSYTLSPESKARCRDSLNKYVKTRKQSDPVYAFSCNVRSLISKAFVRQRYSKKTKARKILGADFSEVFEHLQNNFKNNYKIEWDDKYLNLLHIDHVIPISSAKSKDDVINLNHYSNLQYLWSKHNLEKSDNDNWVLSSSKIKEFKIYLGKR